jgi:hypothetical protein
MTDTAFLSLSAPEATLQIPLQNSDWCQLTLELPGKSVPLGAEPLAAVLERLVAGFAAPREPSQGSLGGHAAYCVLSLSEVHFTLYVAFVDGNRLLFWQSGEGIVRHTQTLEPQDWARWHSQIEEARQALSGSEKRAT